MNNIELIEATEKDYDEYYRIRSSPSDIYWNGYNDKPDYSSFRRIFLNRIFPAPFERDQDRRIYLIKYDKKVYVGFVQLIRHVDCIEVGYSIIEEYQNLGYATEALQNMIPIALRYCSKIIVRIRDDNGASQRVAIKNGFIRTNTYVEQAYPIVGYVKLRTYVLDGRS